MAYRKYQKWLKKDGLTLLEGWAREGLADEQIAHNMGIARSTLNEWKKKYPDISDTLEKGKDVIDFEVENALLKRAIGYDYDEIKTYISEAKGKQTKRVEKVRKHIPGDPGAAMFWLKNRRPEQWTAQWKHDNELKKAQAEKLRKEMSEESGEQEPITIVEGTDEMRRYVDEHSDSATH
ncbi:MAG: hypothetical protein ACE3JK_14500 [Sporolactobacillus sp.]